jgi:hypothetical protein
VKKKREFEKGDSSHIKEGKNSLIHNPLISNYKKLLNFPSNPLPAFKV